MCHFCGCTGGLALFRDFLRSEYSDENLEFWIACEEYQTLKDDRLVAQAQKIFADFVAIQAPREVSCLLCIYYAMWMYMQYLYMQRVLWLDIFPVKHSLASGHRLLLCILLISFTATSYFPRLRLKLVPRFFLQAAFIGVLGFLVAFHSVSTSCDAQCCDDAAILSMNLFMNTYASNLQLCNLDAWCMSFFTSRPIALLHFQ